MCLVGNHLAGKQPPVWEDAGRRPGPRKACEACRGTGRACDECGQWWNDPRALNHARCGPASNPSKVAQEIRCPTCKGYGTVAAELTAELHAALIDQVGELTDQVQVMTLNYQGQKRLAEQRAKELNTLRGEAPGGGCYGRGVGTRYCRAQTVATVHVGGPGLIHPDWRACRSHAEQAERIAITGVSGEVAWDDRAGQSGNASCSYCGKPCPTSGGYTSGLASLCSVACVIDALKAEQVRETQ